MVTEAIHRNVIYPSILAARGEFATFRLLRKFGEYQWDPLERIRERQHKKLVATLAFARNNCQWYAERLTTTLDESTSRSTSLQLSDLPFLTKEDVQKNADLLIPIRTMGRVHKKTTGGSTGEPVTVAKDSHALAAERAATWLGYGWFGVRIGDRGARFWGSPVDRGRRRLRFDLADRAMNRIRFSAFGIDDSRMERYWSDCRNFHPRYLYGYVSFLEAFAHYIGRQGIDGSTLRLKSVITTSEMLSEPQRSLLESTFGCPVQNEYGCGEVGPITYQCQEGKLHEMAENLLVELIRPDGTEALAGELGEVVVTDLRNRAMPLIRYRLADHAIRGENCRCGRGMPVIEAIKGREYDFVQTPDGRLFHGEFFMYAIEDLRDDGIEIERFRVIQTSPTDLRVELQTRDSRARSATLDRLSRELGGLALDIVVTPLILPGQSGKLRVVENRTAPSSPRS